MKRLMVHLMTSDPAGTVFRLSSAINRYLAPEWVSRCICTRRLATYGWDYDLAYDGDSAGEILELCQEADVFVLHKPQELHFGLRGATITQHIGERAHTYQVDEMIRCKPRIYCHHGEPSLRNDTRRVLMSYAASGVEIEGNVYVVTPDLLALVPGAKFIPNVVPFLEPAILQGHDGLKSKSVRVMQAPTDIEGQTVVDVLEAVKRVDRAHLARETGKRYSYESVINQPWRRALWRKRHCDVGVDHFRGWWGLNALEFAAMGSPAVCNVMPENLAHLQRFFAVTGSPFTCTPLADLDEMLERLGNDDYRAKTGAAARQWMHEKWNNARIVQAVVDMAEQQIERGEQHEV